MVKIDNTAPQIPLKHQVGNAEEKKEAELRNACEEFEAIILEKLLAGMRESIPEGGIFEKSFSEDMFQSMYDQELAQELAHSRGTGLGELLFNQIMEKQKA